MFCIPTVNTASRMEATSAEGRIHLSERAAAILTSQVIVPSLQHNDAIPNSTLSTQNNLFTHNAFASQYLFIHPTLMEYTAKCCLLFDRNKFNKSRI